MKGVFLNISNHLATKWDKKQVDAAYNLFPKIFTDVQIIDIPFPNIDPYWTTVNLKDQAEQFYIACTSTNNIWNLTKPDLTIFHVMGEMGFTYNLIECIKAYQTKEIYHSTTERIVSVDSQGNKVVTFNFVQFRRY